MRYLVEMQGSYRESYEIMPIGYCELFQIQINIGDQMLESRKISEMLNYVSAINRFNSFEVEEADSCFCLKINLGYSIKVKSFQQLDRILKKYYPRFGDDIVLVTRSGEGGAIRSFSLWDDKNIRLI